MLTNHLKILLNKQNRVIVPELGAFLLKGEDRQTIYFNEFLRFNDGLLLDYVAEQEHIEIMDAAHMIKNFADEINRKLQADRSVEIDGIGKLYLDSNDKIQINNLHSIDQKIDQHSEEKQINNKNIVLSHSILSDSQNNNKLSNENGEDKQKILYFKEIKKTSKNKKSDNTSQFTSVLLTRNVISIASVVVIVLVLAYLLIAHQIRPKYIVSNESIGKDTIFEKLLISKNKNSSSKQTAKGKQDSVNQSDSEISSLKSKPPVESGLSKSVLSKPEPVNQSPRNSTVIKSKKYFIVAGCFSDELNANHLIEKLKAQGYFSEKFATINNLYYVSYASYDTKDSASKVVRDLSIKGQSAWIMFH